MAKSVLDIVIKLSKEGGADKDTVKGLLQVKSSIMDAVTVAGTFVAAGYAIKKGLDETVGTLINYAEEVRRVQNATGASAEDASKLIQILDDQKISYEQLEKAVAKNGKTYDYSIQGLANMSDEYLKLTSANEQAAFMQERFGKQWISFVPVMQQGGQAIRDQADAVSDSLVLTQQAVDQAREYEIATDNLSDAFQGLKISLGKDLLPVVTGFINNLNAAHRAQEILGKDFNAGVIGTDKWNRALEQAKTEQQESTDAMLQHKEALDRDSQSAEENAQAIKEVTKAHQDMLGVIGKVADAERGYEETAKRLNQERIQIEGQRSAAIQAGWQEGSDKIKDFDAALEENAQKAEENAQKHHEAMGKIQYDLLVTKLSADGLTDAEFEIAQQAGLMFGVFDQNSVDQARNMDKLAQAVADGTISVKDMKRALDSLPKNKSIDVTLNAIVKIANANAFLGGSHTTHTQQSEPGGYQEGGIATGPKSGHWELLHGTEAVIPLQSGAVPVQVSGAGAGGDNFYINLTISSPVTILDEQRTKTTLLPYIIDGVRQAKAQGAIQ